MRQNPHVRICGGPGSATTLVYPTALARRLTGILFAMWRDHAPFDGRCSGAGVPTPARS